MQEGTTLDGAEMRQSAQYGQRFLDGYISEAQFAAQRGVSIRTCQRDRQLRQAPPFVTLGRQVFYRIEAVREWLIEHERCEDRRAEAPRARKFR